VNRSHFGLRGDPKLFFLGVNEYRQAGNRRTFQGTPQGRLFHRMAPVV